MLAAVLRAHPHLRGTLVDLPRTVASAGQTFEAAGVTARVMGQSFFDPLPPDLDAYLLRGVLNDWPDREAIAILRRCAQAAGTKGRVIVLKGIVPDGKPRPLSIEMILVGGKNRTVSEFQHLARQAGLKTLIHSANNGRPTAECSSA